MNDALTVVIPNSFLEKAKGTDKALIVGFILDETASMGAVVDETISGFNEYLDTLQAQSEKEDLPIALSLTKFNAEKIKTLPFERLGKVARLNRKNYVPTANTPLYDAVGQTIRSFESALSLLGANTNDLRILFVIQTDGEENFSREWTKEKIQKLIKDKEKDGWQFAFLAADQDAWLAGHGMGMASPGNTMSYDSAFTKDAFHNAALSTVAYASSGSRKTETFWDKDDDQKP